MLRSSGLATFVFSLALAATVGCDEGGGEEGQAGQLGEPCLGGTFCNEGLVCAIGVCMSEGSDEASESSSTGDTGSTESTSTESTTGTLFELYEGPCDASDQCANGGWCTESYWFCSVTCMVDADCPSYPGASASPQCTAVFGEVDSLSTSQWGCALECNDSSECPAGTQCWAVGTSTWCGY